MKPFNYTRRRNKKGGIPIFAGAQGCVFKPSLKCKNQIRNYHDGNISKLCERISAESEMREFAQIKRHLVRIKNYNKFFGIKAHLCEPDVLDHNDLENFDEVCVNMKEHKITAANVNANLNRLRMINMPDLGIDLTKWIEQTELNSQQIQKLNNHISTLLVNAVEPMNRLGVIHNDLKSENVMIDAKEDVRIIDWGLAGISTEHQVIPLQHFMYNPVSFNRPFSTMIISPTSVEMYASTFLNQPQMPSLNQVKQFTRGLYKKYIESYNMIGYNYLQYIFMSIFGLNEKNATEFLVDSVANYNADILYHFTDSATQTFRLNEYFRTIYRYNTDIWGLMSIFYSIFMLPRVRFVMSNKSYANMLHRYRALFRSIVFVNGHKRMNVPNILHHLREINNALDKNKKKTVQFTARANMRKSIKRIPTPHPHKIKIIAL